MDPVRFQPLFRTGLSPSQPRPIQLTHVHFGPELRKLNRNTHSFIRCMLHLRVETEEDELREKCWGRVWALFWQQGQEEEHRLCCRLFHRIPSPIQPLVLQEKMFSSQALLHLRRLIPLSFSPESSFMMESAISATKVFEQSLLITSCSSTDFLFFLLFTKTPNIYLPFCGGWDTNALPGFY